MTTFAGFSGLGVGVEAFTLVSFLCNLTGPEAPIRYHQYSSYSKYLVRDSVDIDIEGNKIHELS